MSARHADLAAFVAGELDDIAAEAMRRHLATCAGCQGELEQLLLEETVTHPDGRASQRDHTPIAPQRSSLGVPVAAACALAAAAMVALWWWRSHEIGRPPAEPERAVALADGLGAERALELRLAAVDRYRPYAVTRGATEPHDDVPLAVLAALERRRDWSALFAAHALRGELAAAAKALAREDAGATRDSDAAALALAQHRPELALGHAAAALARSPRAAAALWNDALARRDLRLPLSAAARFDEVAALGEPGWSDEARTAAARLRATADERRAAWRRARELTGNAERLATIDLALARRFPDLAIAGLWEALRSSAGADARRFTALARALDESAGTKLADAVQRAARTDAARTPLAAEYARLLAARGAADDWTRLARRAAVVANASDIALGAAAHALASDATAADLVDRLVPLDDTWLTAWADEQRARANIYLARRTSAAEVQLARSTAACASDRLPARCARLESLLAVVLAERGRRDAAVAHLERAFAAADRAQDWSIDLDLLYIAGEISVGRDPNTVDRVVLASAYLDERSLEAPDCRSDLYRLDHLAVAALDLNRAADARRWSDEADALSRGRCSDVGPRLNGLLVRARLLQHSGEVDAPAVAQLLRDIAALRPRQQTAGMVALLDVAEGRALVERDRATGVAALERASAAGAARDADALALRARDLALGVLALDAGRRGERGQAVEAIARQLGTATPTQCALAITGEDRVLAIAIGRDGATAATYRAVVDRAVASATDVVADELVTALGGCDVVDVYAPGIYYGQAGLLPRAVAWRYRSPIAAPSGPPTAGPRVVVTDVQPPPTLGLPALHDSPDVAGAVVIRGGAATPRRVLAEIGAASEIEIHAHGIVDVAEPTDAALLLSPDADGDHALDAERVRATRLRGRPLVLLAACHAARVPTADRAWGLADAFLAAGARSVVAATDALPDAGLAHTFAEIAQAVHAGSSVARALRDQRVAHPDRLWLDSIIVFE